MNNNDRQENSQLAVDSGSNEGLALAHTLWLKFEGKTKD
jgi:hypothetical protein